MINGMPQRSGKPALVPEERTMMQPVAGFCRNPECREPDPRNPAATTEFRFTVEHDHFACPKCGANRTPMIGTIVLTHFLMRDDEGHVNGRGGLRYRIACDQNRAYLATIRNEEAATDNPLITNCPGCIAIAEKQGVKGIHSNPLSQANPPKRSTLKTPIPTDPSH